VKLLWFGFIIAFLLLLVSCKPSPEVFDQAVHETLAAMSTWTPLATLTSYPTLTSQATYTKPPTYTPVPTYTAIPSLAPTATITPTGKSWREMTIEELRAANHPIIGTHPPGIYLVEVDICPGYWRSQVQGNDDCYWEITDTIGRVLINHFGLSGGTMVIPPRYKHDPTDAYQVTLGPGCGDWEYLYFVPDQSL